MTDAIFDFLLLNNLAQTMEQILIMKGKAWDETPPPSYSNEDIECFRYISQINNLYVGNIRKNSTDDNK